MTEEKIRRLSTLNRQLTLGPEDFSLQSIISILKLTHAQRLVRQSLILHEFTKNIKFFKDLVAENGEYVQKASCERLTYEFVPAGQVNLK